MEQTKPNYLKPNMENIPNRLKEYDQWVLWKGVFKDNKWTKVPYMAPGKQASTTNKSTWSSFKSIETAYSSNGNEFDGIGFVLTREDPFTGWDFDGCRNEKNETEPEIKQAIKSLDSYSELSPSGTGYRVMVEAVLPDGGRKNGAVECYDNARYLTITGIVPGDLRRTVEHRQKETTSLHRKYFPVKEKSVIEKFEQPLADGDLLERAFTSKFGSKIKELYDGNFAGYYSQSEADQALCNHLAFWLNREADRIDAMFRSSGLYRDKWDKKHYADGRTYGQETVQKAINSCRDVYKGNITLTPAMGKFESPSDASEEMIIMSTTMEFPSFQEEPVIGSGILPSRGGMVIAGESGVGKSLLRMQLALQISFGVDFWGFEIPIQRKVAVFQYENTLKQEFDRIKMMCAGLGINVLDGGIEHIPRHIRYNVLKGDKEKLYDRIARTGAGENAGVIQYDPLSCFHSGMENSNEVMREVLEVFSQINSRLGTTAQVIHHFGKPSQDRHNDFRTRGAVAIKDWATTEVHYTKIGRDPDRELRKFEVVKMRDAKKPKPITLELGDDLVLRETDEESVCPPKKVREILESNGGEVDSQNSLAKLISDEVSCVRQTAINCIKRAVEFRTITPERTGKGKGKSIKYTV